MKEGNLETDAGRGRCHVKKGAEIGYAELQGITGDDGRGERQHRPTNTSGSDFQPPEPQKDTSDRYERCIRDILLQQP